MVGDEKELLELFARRVRELDPDILSGWSSHDFDVPVLLRRAAELGVQLHIGRGPGPHSPPLLVGARLFTVGTNRRFFALDKSSGEVLWQHDLVADLGAPSLQIRPIVKSGYGCSPIAWKDTVNVPMNGTVRVAVRFDENRPGEWMYHCHILDHADLGMMGTVLVGDEKPTENGSSHADQPAPRH